MIRQVRVNPIQDSTNQQPKASNEILLIPDRSSSSDFIRTIKQQSPEQIQKAFPLYFNSPSTSQFKYQNFNQSQQQMVVQKDKYRSLSPCNQSHALNSMKMIYTQDPFQQQNGTSILNSSLSSTTNSFQQTQSHQLNQSNKKQIQQLKNIAQAQQKSTTPIPLQQISIDNNQILTQQQQQQHGGVQIIKQQQISQTNQQQQTSQLQLQQQKQPKISQQQQMIKQEQPVKTVSSVQIQQIQQNDQMIYTIGGKVNDLSKEIHRLLTLNEKLIQEAVSWRQKYELCDMRKQILEQELEQRKLMVKNYSQSLNTNLNDDSQKDINERNQHQMNSDFDDIKQVKNNKQKNKVIQRHEAYQNLNKQSNTNNFYDDECTMMKNSDSIVGSRSEDDEDIQKKYQSKDYNFQHIVRQISSLESLKKISRIEDLHSQIEKLIEENQNLKQKMAESKQQSSEDILSQSSYMLDEGEEDDLRKQQLKSEDYYIKMSKKEKIKWKITNLTQKCERLEKENTEWKIQNWNLKKEILQQNQRDDSKDFSLKKLEEEKDVIHSSLCQRIQELESGIQKFSTNQKSIYQFFDKQNIFYHQQSNQLSLKNNQQPVQIQHSNGSPKSVNSSTSQNNQNKNNFMSNYTQNSNNSPEQSYSSNQLENSYYNYHSDQNKNNKKAKSGLKYSDQQNFDSKSSTSSNGYAKEIIEKAMTYAGNRQALINNPSQSVKTVEYNFNQSFQHKQFALNKMPNKENQKQDLNYYDNNFSESIKLTTTQESIQQQQQQYKNSKFDGPTFKHKSQSGSNEQQQTQQKNLIAPTFSYTQNLEDTFSNIMSYKDSNQNEKLNDPLYQEQDFDMIKQQQQNEMQQLAQKQKQQLENLQENQKNKGSFFQKESYNYQSQESGSQNNQFNYEFQNIKRIKSTQKSNLSQFGQHYSPLSNFSENVFGNGNKTTQANRYQADIKYSQNEDVKKDYMSYQVDSIESFHNNPMSSYNNQPSLMENNQINSAAFTKTNVTSLYKNTQNKQNETYEYQQNNDQKMFNNQHEIYASVNSESFQVNHSFSDKENFQSNEKNFQQQLSPQFVYQSNDSFYPKQNY